MNIEVVVGNGEADTEAAVLCREKKYFGVLAEDSDYFLMQVNYIPIKSIGFFTEDDVDVATCRLFVPEKIQKGTVPVSSSGDVVLEYVLTSDCSSRYQTGDLFHLVLLVWERLLF